MSFADGWFFAFLFMAIGPPIVAVLEAEYNKLFRKPEAKEE